MVKFEAQQLDFSPFFFSSPTRVLLDDGRCNRHLGHARTNAKRVVLCQCDEKRKRKRKELLSFEPGSTKMQWANRTELTDLPITPWLLLN